MGRTLYGGWIWFSRRLLRRGAKDQVLGTLWAMYAMVWRPVELEATSGVCYDFILPVLSYRFKSMLRVARRKREMALRRLAGRPSMNVSSMRMVPGE